MKDERTINPNAPADFTPQLGGYKTLQPFRYWCQKVLPLVYDDSLSYYELLCKVVDYLNKTMEDVETLHDDVTNLHTAYEQLQNYVNTYFSTLDVQQEINNKLDVMATNGTLSNLLAPLVQGFSMPTFVNSVSEMTDTTKVYVLTTNGHVYSYKNGAWTDSGYVYGTNNLFFQAGTTVTSSSQLSSLGDALPNRTYLIGINSPDTLPDFPIGAAQYGNLITFNHVASNDAMVQFWFDCNGRMFARNHWENKWNEWYDISNKYAVHTGPTITSTKQLASLADAEPNTMYLIGIYDSTESIPDAPTNFYYGALLTMNHISNKNDATIQIWATAKGDIWIRNHWGSSWLPWVHVNQDTLDNWENVPEEPSNLYWCFKSFGIIGDSLASGAEQDPYNSNTWKFPVETRWGQYLKQDSGREVKYFSEDGLTTRTWLSSSNGYTLAEQSTNFCQCYLIGLGENDVNRLGESYLGSISDINDSNPDANGDTYYGNYGKIIQKMKALVPNARFFLMTNPYNETGLRLQYNDAVRKIADHFEKCYLLDLAKDYASEYNQPGFIASSRVGGHYDASAYLYMGKLIARSMNKVIFNNGSDFYGMWFIPTT